VYFGTNLYVVGYHAGYKEVRTLKVSRLRGVQMTGRRFERPADFSLEAYLDGSFGIFSPGPLQTIEVRFTGWAATNLREHQWHPSQTVVKDSPAGLTARFRLSDTHEFKRWLLGYGRCATVLKPKSFADEMREELCAACENYGEGKRKACRTRAP
jgi:proteasome accessory factor B